MIQDHNHLGMLRIACDRLNPITRIVLQAGAVLRNRRLDAGQGGARGLELTGTDTGTARRFVEVSMTTKILCPIDGTPHAQHALASAAEMATKLGATLSICVVNIAHGGGRGPLIHHWTDADAQKILDAAEATAQAHGQKLAHKAVVIDREAASGIVGYAEMHHIDHIVMGTGDKHGFSRLMLGSVAADVAARAHCTVTVAR